MATHTTTDTGTGQQDQQTVAQRLGRPSQMWARIRSTDEEMLRVRLRLQYQPLVAAGAVATMGLVQHLALTVGVSELASAATTGVAITTTLAVLRRQQKGWWAEAATWVRAHPRRALLAGAAAWVWLIAAALCDWSSWQALATSGLWAWVGLSAHWWRLHRIGYTPLPTPQHTSQQQEDVGAHYARLWQENLTADSGVFKGTALHTHRVTDVGHLWDVSIRPGSKGLQALQANTADISTALGVAQHMLSLSPHPCGSPLLAELRVTTNSPTTGGVDISTETGVPTIEGHPVWDAETGDIVLGPYADGQGIHTWGLYRTNSIRGGYCFGAQGSGKSELLNLLALGVRLSGRTTFWYVDGQDGTQPSLQHTADWDASATAYKRRVALEAAVIALRVRMRTNRAHGAKGFTPTRERPGLVLIMDESHMIINDYVRVPAPTEKEIKNGAAPDPGFGQWTNAELVNEITRIGRKCGIAAVPASQDTGMGAFGGNGNPGRVIRGNLFSANTALMYSQDAIAGTIAPKAAMSVTDLPTGGGYAVAANETGQDGAVHARTAMWRAAYRDENDPRGSITNLIAAAGPCLRLEPEAAHAIDALLKDAYSRRHDTNAEQRAAADAATVQAFLDGEASVTELLFGGDATPPRPGPHTTTGAPGVLIGLPNVTEFTDTVDDTHVPDFIRDVLGIFDAAGETRMHNEPLAHALGMSVEAMKKQMLAFDIRALPESFVRNGQRGRGYARTTIEKAAQRYRTRAIEDAS